VEIVEVRLCPALSDYFKPPYRLNHIEGLAPKVAFVSETSAKIVAVIDQTVLTNALVEK
jgi:hypothetical protein